MPSAPKATGNIASTRTRPLPPHFQPRPHSSRQVVHDPTRIQTPLVDEYEVVLSNSPTAYTSHRSNARPNQNKVVVHEIRPRVNQASKITHASLPKFSEDAGSSTETSSSPSPALTTSPEPLQASRPRLTGVGMSALARHISPGQTAKDSKSSCLDAGAAKFMHRPKWLTPPKAPASYAVHVPDTEVYMPHQVAQTATPIHLETATPHFVDTPESKPMSHVNAEPRPRRNVLPDLFRVAEAARRRADIARPPPTFFNGLQATIPFSFDPLPYTDADIPLPEAYNALYPHPLTAYASPGVNPFTVKASGYDLPLNEMAKTNLEMAIGSILYESGLRDLESSVYLLFSLFHEGGEGNGIPESLWSKLDSYNTIQMPVGIGGISPYARFDSSMPAVPAPRFLAASNQGSRYRDGGYFPPTPSSSGNESDYFNPRHTSHYDGGEFEPTPRPSPNRYDCGRSRHWSSASDTRPPLGDSQCLDPSFHNGSFNFVHPSNFTHREASDLRRYGAPTDSFHDHMSSYPHSPKTEMCRTWATTGDCQWQDMCQYAHGFEELHANQYIEEQNFHHYAPRMYPASINQREYDQHHQMAARGSYPSQILFPNQQPSGPILSNAVLTTEPLRAESRRASCPAPPLTAVPELEDDFPFALPQRRQSDLVPAPIGAGRPTISSLSMSSIGLPPGASRSNGVAFSPTDSAGMSTASFDDRSSTPGDIVPSFTHHSHRPKTSNVSTAPPISTGTSTSTSTSTLRSPPSSLSLSTSSGSRYSMFTQYSEASPQSASTNLPFPFTPADAKVYMDRYGGNPTSGEYGPGTGYGNGDGNAVTRQGSSTSLDFSTGKSIWN